MVFILSIFADVRASTVTISIPLEPPIVTGYKPFGSPNIGEFFLPVMKKFLGKGND